MNKDILKQIILDNRVEVERYKVFRREVDMSSFPCYVLVGLRRAGKSFMLYQRMQQLLSQGHNSGMFCGAVGQAPHTVS